VLLSQLLYQLLLLVLLLLLQTQDFIKAQAACQAGALTHLMSGAAIPAAFLAAAAAAAAAADSGLHQGRGRPVRVEL
jgi:hypothetical protein